MSMHDLFGWVDDPVTEACRMLAEHDPNHPYVRKLIGCGHGRLFSEPCEDCEIVKLHEQYTNAIRTVQIVRDRLRVLGAPLPGRLAP